MTNGKRKGSVERHDLDDRTGQKRVRFQPTHDNDIEIDHQDALEPTKQRRGAVNTDAYASDDEVDGGVYSSDNDSDEESGVKGKGKAVNESAGDDFDMFGDADLPAMPAKKKTLAMGDIEGQEFGSHDMSDDDDNDHKEGEGERPKKKKAPSVMAFNMQQELEEGSFDAQGNYVLNKGDPQAFHDRWMEGISRRDIKAAREAQAKREKAEALLEAERQASMPQTKTGIYKAMVVHLKPGQSVSEVLAGLGGGTSQKVPAWKQKLLDKKNKTKKPTQQLNEEEEAKRKATVERITELADQMMALGHFDIYQDTYEIMLRVLRQEGVVGEEWVPDH